MRAVVVAAGLSLSCATATAQDRPDPSYFARQEQQERMWRAAAEARAERAERRLAAGAGAVMFVLTVVAWRRGRRAYKVSFRLAACAALLGGLWLVSGEVFAAGTWVADRVRSKPEEFAMWAFGFTIGPALVIGPVCAVVLARRYARQAAARSSARLADLAEELPPAQRRALAAKMEAGSEGSPSD